MDDLLSDFDAQVDRALAQLRETQPHTLIETRPVGQLQLPATTLGLLFHAASTPSVTSARCW